MIGLCFKGEPVLGVVHAPARRVPKTHYAVAGQGAFVLTGDACGEGLAGSARLRCGGVFYHRFGVGAVFPLLLQTRRARRRWTSHLLNIGTSTRGETDLERSLSGP